MTDFPDVPDDLAVDKKLEWEKSLFDAKLKRVESIADAEETIDAEFFKSLFAVAQGSIDRARASADTVQKASAAIAALYTSLLGVAFSIKENPLPSRAIIPMLFLGVAVVASTAYLAYQTRPGSVGVLTPRGSAYERNLERARSLIEWTRASAENRGYMLKLSVIALAAGLAFLPAPWVSFNSADMARDTAGTAAALTGEERSPDWPSVSANAGDEVELQKIVYAAQVTEATEQRKQKTAPVDTGSDEKWWEAAAGAAILMLFLPYLIDWIHALAGRFAVT